MTTKYTPGPWFVSGEGRSGLTMRVRNSDFATAIATVHARVDRDANARLIAAAPELVEALREVEHAEAEYRHAHDVFGGGDIRTGRAWDAMCRAGDAARALLAHLKENSDD